VGLIALDQIIMIGIFAFRSISKVGFLIPEQDATILDKYNTLGVID